MSDLDDQCNRFSDSLANLIMSAMRNDLPPRCVANALVRAIVAIAVGAEIDINGLAADLVDTAAEIDTEFGQQPEYLH